MIDTRLDGCRFCGRFTDREDAIDQGWVPYFYDGETSVDQATCPDCVKEHLRYNEDDGEWEIKPGHHLPDAVN